MLNTLAIEPNRPRIIHDGAIEVLFSIIHSAHKSAPRKCLAMEILSLLCSRRESHRKIAFLNGGTGLQRIISLVASGNETVGTYAATAISHLASSNSLLAVLLQSTVLPQIVALMRRKSPAAVTAALDALTAIARTNDGRAAVSSAGGCIRRALRLAQSTDRGMARRAALLLAALAEDDGACRRMLANEGRDALRAAAVAAAAASDEEAQQATESALQRLAEVAESRTGELVVEAVKRLRRQPATGPAGAPDSSRVPFCSRCACARVASRVRRDVVHSAAARSLSALRSPCGWISHDVVERSSTSEKAQRT